jgi:hypothetical protein
VNMVTPVSWVMNSTEAQRGAYVEDCEAQHQDEHCLHVPQHLCNEQYKVFRCTFGFTRFIDVGTKKP